MMYFRISEIVAAAVIYGFLWTVIPWDPLSMFDEIVVCLCLMVTSFSLVIIAESAFHELRRMFS